MPALVLLNGPPAAGKSTLARLLVDRRPLALNLDIDLIRAQLGAWADRPTDAGLAARALAIGMASTHLAGGSDVVVPQFLGRVGFIEELEAVASAAGAVFVEIVLWLDRQEAADAFAERSRAPTDPSHRDAAMLVERSDAVDPLGDSWEAVVEVLRHRTGAVVVPVERGRPDATFHTVLAELRRRGIDGWGES